ncbi:glycerophosphodiester phosphodiesterase [Rubrobacter marinus]|uniref:Glycerophosphodiester phosphodiesterase n=1 Tax=Rubrobacter marinus TaxID=2653852 RepID=A0A6G8PVK2_9ACTN|nr:glycerophosphodiester phosphodiesterase [Rubrobacter marinus]QIN78241.1 glycerophosphodiester phosphodiesterase [Rubrobacter marinus]
MRKSRLLAAAAAGGGLLAVVAARRGRGRRPVDRDWPVALAHRGASARAPENTLEAFGLAAASGAGGLETDVHMTLDGRIVAFHDDTVDRTTDGSGLVREMTLAELKELDAGYRFTPDGGETYPYRGRGVRVPEIGEVLRAFPDLAVNIEIKEEQPGVEAALLRVIEEEGALERALVASGRAGPVARFRRLSGGRVRTGASAREIVLFYYGSRLRLDGLLRPPYDALQVPAEHRGTPVVTPRFLEAAHGLGVRVDVWTVDDPGEMRRLLDLGADGIMTNRPEVLQGVLRQGAAPQPRVPGGPRA